MFNTISNILGLIIGGIPRLVMSIVRLIGKYPILSLGIVLFIIVSLGVGRYREVLSKHKEETYKLQAKNTALNLELNTTKFKLNTSEAENRSLRSDNRQLDEMYRSISKKATRLDSDASQLRYKLNQSYQIDETSDWGQQPIPQNIIDTLQDGLGNEPVGGVYAE